MDGDTELIVGVYDATDGGPQHDQTFGKQSRSAFDSPSGFMYTGSSGLWDTVWLECVPASAFISDLAIKPDFDLALVEVTVIVNMTAASAASRFDVVIAVLDGATVVANATGHISNVLPTATSDPQSSVVVKVSMPTDFKHWSPVSPFLYNLTATLTAAASSITDATADTVSAYVGMRKISVAQVATNGQQQPAIMLNNKPFYQVRRSKMSIKTSHTTPRLLAV